MKILLPILVLMLSVAAYFMYIVPTTMEVKVLMAEKARYVELLDKTKEIVSLRDKILNDYNSISEDDLLRLNKVVPETFNHVIFLNDLNSLAAKYNLKLSDYKSSVSASAVSGAVAIVDSSGKRYKSHTVNFRVTGQYAQFVSFLNDVETSLQLVDVVGLLVSPAGTEIKDGSLIYQIEVTTYSLK